MSKFKDLLAGRKKDDGGGQATHKEKLEQGWRRFYTLLPPGEHLKLKIRAAELGADMADVTRFALAKALAEGIDPLELEAFLRDEDT